MLCACAMVAGALQGQTEATAEGPSEQRASERSDPNGAQRNEGTRPKNYTLPLTQNSLRHFDAP